MDENKQAAVKLYRKIRQEIRHIFEEDSFDCAAAWTKIDAANRRRAHIGRRMAGVCYALSGAAAAVLLLLALPVADFWGKGNAPAELCMSVGNGNHSDVILPDGTVVKLNAGSTVSYVLMKNERRAVFQGEGFFKVARNRAPFIIYMNGGLQLKALGTAFNLCAYDNDPDVKASLLEGCIALSNENGKEIKLKAGEMAVYNRQTAELCRKNGVVSHSCGWIDDKIYMDDMPLSELCRKLERRYDVRIAIHGQFGDSIRYNGVLQEETIAETLHSFVKISHIRYRMTGKQIDIIN